MTVKKKRKKRTYIYSEADHRKARKYAEILVNIKEDLKPINKRLSKLRADRLIEK